MSLKFREGEDSKVIKDHECEHHFHSSGGYSFDKKEMMIRKKGICSLCHRKLMRIKRISATHKAFIVAQ